MKQPATTAPDFLVVDKHVALNPVARAIARQAMRSAFTTFQIKLYQLADGERVPEDCQAAAKCLAVATAVLELQGRTDTVDMRVIAGGMGALTDVASTGWLWRTRHATAVDEALKRAHAAYDQAPARVVQLAHLKVHELERRMAQQVTA